MAHWQKLSNRNPYEADYKHRRGKPVVLECIAGIVDGIAETGGDPEKLGRDQHDPGDTDREANAAQRILRDRG